MSNVAKIKLVAGEDGQWYYEPTGGNGETLSTSEGYTRREDAVRAAAEAYPDVTIEDA
jgi:uncharacterized protein YegP (UPF0339 family)